MPASASPRRSCWSLLRLLQGLALGGEYGGAATYVAEHAPEGRRGFYTSWIQTTATLGLFAALLVVIGTRTMLGEEAFQDWGWRIPFLLSLILLGISLWIRLQLAESPAFVRMKEEGTRSKAPIREAFGQWPNARIVLIALFGAVAGQAVVWYAGQFYALFFLERVLKVDAAAANIMIAIALVLATPFFVLFGWLSDRIGRKPIIMAGLLLAAVTYFPLFKALTWAANPALATAQMQRPGHGRRRPGRLLVPVRSDRQEQVRRAPAATSPNPSSRGRACPTPMAPAAPGKPGAGPHRRCDCRSR